MNKGQFFGEPELRRRCCLALLWLGLPALVVGHVINRRPPANGRGKNQLGREVPYLVFTILYFVSRRIKLCLEATVNN